MDYSQPAFYRFNEDSLRLVEMVCKHHQSASTLLDAGAGCGIIGIETARRMNVGQLHFLEIQEEFKEHINFNVKAFLHNSPTLITISSFADYHLEYKYELIVCNPPYYLPGKGEPNKNQFRGICRSFQIDSWRELLNLFQRGLGPQGSAWVVIKNDYSVLRVIESELRHTALEQTLFTANDLVFLKFTFHSEYKY